MPEQQALGLSMDWVKLILVQKSFNLSFWDQEKLTQNCAKTYSRFDLTIVGVVSVSVFCHHQKYNNVNTKKNV